MIDEIEKLAAQLREKTHHETHHITLDEIENLIKNRHISQLQDLFSADERKKEQTYKLFYMYDRKGRRQVGNEKIVYKDHEYLVVRATRGWREPSKAARKRHDAQAGFYHAAWVFGIADGNPWIHRLEWDANFENDVFKWTREYILKKMRFSASVDDIISFENDIISFEKGEVIRLQGDLTIQKTQTIQEYEEFLKNNYLYAEKNQFWKNFEKIAIEKNKTEIDTRKSEIEADATLAESLDKSEKTKAGSHTLKRLKKKYGITDGITARRTRIDSKIRNKKYAIDAEILIREREKQGYDTLLANHLLNAEKTFVMILQQKQINVRIGNHLIIVERAQKTRSNEDEVVVLEDSRCYIIHDEHENRIITLDAGMYRFGLLARHITDRR